MSVLERLRARREELIREARAACQPASDAARALTDDEQRRYDAAVDELDRVDERIKQLANDEQRARDAAGTMDRYRAGARRYRRTPIWPTHSGA